MLTEDVPFLINVLCYVKFVKHVVLIELRRLNGKEVFVYCRFLRIVLILIFLKLGL
jgi:hypothetical protein